MKSLPLENIIKSLNGKVLQGSSSIVVGDLVTLPKRLRPFSLCLDIYNKYDKQEIKNKHYPCAIITDNPDKFINLEKNITIIKVTDIKEAYWKFIEFYRSLFKIPIIGVTGTCGKTTTKEMIKHILSASFNVSATYKSYNALHRDLGYLLNINDNTEAAVYEMGVAYANDLSTSCRYFKPQVGVITNIGIDHLNAFGTIDAYIKGKAEFLEGLQNKGTLILNADDENIKKIDLSKYKGNIIYFGFSEESHFRISDVAHLKDGIEFSLNYKEITYKPFVPGYGEFNAYNATAAIAATHSIGLDIAECIKSLSSFVHIEKHFELNEGINNSLVIDDTWSTNPTSSLAALKLLKQLSQGKKTIAALGKMSLLGKRSNEYHHEIGNQVAQIGIDQLILMGEDAWEIGFGAIQKGMNKDSIHFCNESNEIYSIIKKSLDKNSMLLVKTTMLASYNDLMDKIIIKRKFL